MRRFIWFALLMAQVGSAQDNTSADYDQYWYLVSKAYQDRASDNPVGTTTIREELGTEEGPTSIVEFKKVVRKRTAQLENLVMTDNTVGKAFPGALLWAAAVRDGQLHELEQVPARPPVTVTFSGIKELPPTTPEIVVSPQTTHPGLNSISFAHAGTFSDFQKKAQPIFERNMSASTKLSTEIRVSESFEDALLSIGLSVKYWGGKLSAGLEHIGQERRSVALLTLDQVFFSVSADAPPLEGYLPDNLIKTSPALAKRLAAGAATGGEIAYVRKVDYGRRILIALSAESSAEQLKDALTWAVEMGQAETTGNITQQRKDVWKTIEGKIVVIGGKFPEGVGALFEGDENAFINAVRSILKKENIAYDPSVGAVPVSFELAYVNDNAPMQVYETTEFAGKIPVRSFGIKQTVAQVHTTGADAAVSRQDPEVDSDDWTLVKLVSQALRLSEDKRTVYYDLIWSVYEAEDDKTIENKTIITSRKTITFNYPKPILRFISPTSIGERDEWYADEVHSQQSFPNHGLLSNIRVRFDGPGDNDQPLQDLQAELRFSVWLEQ